MRICRALAFALVVAAVVLVAPGARAQEGFEHIRRYDVHVHVQPSGTLAVTEEISYDFGSSERHGIYRSIPVRFPYEPKPAYERVYELSQIRVDAPQGTPHGVSVSDENGYKNIRIGDKNKTVRGEHHYTIHYRVRGGLNGFPDHDELFWNAIGAEWDVPIDSATATVTTAGGASRVACYTGPLGSRLECESAAIENVDDSSPIATEARFAQSALGPRSALSVVVAFPKGVVSNTAPILDEKFSLSRAFAVTPRTVGGAVAAGLVALGLVLRMLWRTGRDRRAGATPDERRGIGENAGGPVVFRPPDNARPAQIGVLVDERADPLDVTATIVDLGVRGYLQIDEIPKEGWFGHADWNLVKVKDADDALLTYEQRLMTGLFDGRDEIRLSTLKNTFASDLHAVQDHLYTDCVAHGWFAKRPDRVRSIYLVLGILAVVASIGVFIALIALTHAAIIGIPLVVAALVLAIGHRWAPARTNKGSAALRDTLGFREFIETAEADRMQFAEEENIFAKYLPYAIVFGATEKWAKAFAGLGRDEAPAGMGWYHPYGSWSAFNSASFSRSMDSFAVHTAGTMASTPASSGSSGFGGGGFSGGGGGGGGGGSW